MKAVVFEDYGKVGVQDVPKPGIEDDGDVILRVTSTAICGSDLHVLNGRIPGMTPGGILGHEFIGVVEELGSGVTNVALGDRVLASFMIPCGSCWFCRRREFNRCPDQRVFGYGAFLGDVNGGQAEHVRVPNADLVLRTLDPRLSDEQALFAGDIFTTGYYVAEQAGIEEGASVAVLGCGPVGLLAIQAAKTFNPGVIYAVDTVDQRLEMAQSFGAVPVNAETVHVPSHLQDHTDGRGVDVILECVGAIPALETALDAVRAGGKVAAIGVHSEPEMTLPLNMTFVRGIDLHFLGTANIVGVWDRAMQLIEDGTVDPAAIVSHRLTLDEAVHGYEIFNSREAMKVVLTP